ncbi:unnamed protein product, partial [Urochloa humidicola]
FLLCLLLPRDSIAFFPPLPLAKQPTTGACSFFSSFLQIGTALQSPPSPKQATSGKHPMAEELLKGCAVALMVLTFNCGLAAYLLWGEAVCVASVGLTYLVMVLLLGRHLGCCEPGTHGRIFRRLDAIIFFLSLSVAALLVSRAARTAAPPSASALLVAAAGATALGLGGYCSYLLHRRSSSKKHRQQMILPLVQESRS